MKKSSVKSRWKLADLVDFECLLSNAGRWKKAWRGGVREEIADAEHASEKMRRRAGFRMMLDEVRERESVLPGERVESALRVTGVLLAVVMFLLGVGVVRGLLVDFSYQDRGLEGEVIKYEGRGFNVWILLAVALGVQWVFLIGGVLGYWLWRRWSGSLSLLEGVVLWVVRRVSGQSRAELWRRLQARLRGGRGVIGWRVGRMLQVAGVGYNLGLLIGLFGCLWFMNVGYFWETSLPQFGGESLNRVTHVMTVPMGEHYPGEGAIELTKAGYVTGVGDLLAGASGSISPRQDADLRWSVFFFFSLIVYGLMPRVLMWFGTCWMERRTLAALDFNDSRHRKLWRELALVSRGEVTTTQADGVVVLDIGGVELGNDELRPFLLQRLRVNPEKRYSLGTMDAAESEAAMRAAHEADSGVVFLVDGWNLSPKQVAGYHQEVRAAIGGQMIRYVMVGSEDELGEWAGFVDGLGDSECEIFHYEKR